LWSVVTQFPHNSFVWKGPDGSSVLTHLAVAGYNCNIHVKEACDAALEYRQSDVHDELLCAAGYGDGGGGPTEEQCERAGRLANLRGSPRAGFTTVEAFFDRMHEVEERLPTYRGELYLEYHRGVQTSQSDFKKNLRACERALQAREAVRAVLGLPALEPAQWLRYLFAHFHDAIPGSSVHSVYAELNPELESLAERQLCLAAEEWSEESGGAGRVVFNPLALRRHVILELASADALSPSLTVQRTKGAQWVHLELGGLESVDLAEASSPASLPWAASPRRLYNGRVDAGFNSHGELTSLAVDGQELQIEDPAGLWLHIDQPAQYDAWDIDHSATWTRARVGRDLAFEVLEKGPVRAVLEGKTKIGERSSAVIRYILEAGSEDLKIEIDLDWRERCRLLRWTVQTGYRGTSARYGAPFGSVDRSQIEGLPAAEAQWEVPASRWGAVLDGVGKGLSLISEAKYGFDAKDGRIGISLLRAPTSPDPEADQGRHLVRFAVGMHRDLSHQDGLATAARAETLYSPALLMTAAAPARAPVTLKHAGSVVPSWILPAREGSGRILRLHEVAGSSQRLELDFAVPPKKVECVDLLERPLPGKLRALAPDRYEVLVGPQKIVSVKFC
ncbi:MAG: hypothetical protein HQL31_12590, partial [Planctomycetes bacterium]|nr:hypothetical protein [Planctomycetota bacterium]